jgi:hypothetical protein
MMWDTGKKLVRLQFFSIESTIKNPEEDFPEEA